MSLPNDETGKTVSVRENFMLSPRIKNAAVSFSAEYEKGQKIEKIDLAIVPKEPEQVPLRVRNKRRRSNHVGDRKEAQPLKNESENILEIKEKSITFFGHMNKARRSKSIEPAHVELIKVINSVKYFKKFQ